jgi:hypothetical protein
MVVKEIGKFKLEAIIKEAEFPSQVLRARGPY